MIDATTDDADVHVLRMDLSRSVKDALVIAGYVRRFDLCIADDASLLKVRGIGPSVLRDIRRTAPFIETSQSVDPAGSTQNQLRLEVNYLIELRRITRALEAIATDFSKVVGEDGPDFSFVRTLCVHD